MQGPTAWLAEAQEREGAIVDALETVEQALRRIPMNSYIGPRR